MKTVKIVLLNMVMFFAFVHGAYATKATVVSSGLWKNTTTWENGIIPGPNNYFPDTILVPSGMNLIMSKNWNLSNGVNPMTIIIQGNDGVITMSNTSGAAHELTLPDTSSVRIEQGAALSSSDNNGGFVAGCKLKIGTEYVWTSTSTSFKLIADQAFVVSFDHANSYVNDKDYDNYVRCVRGGQVNITIPVNPAIIMYLLD